MAIITDSTPLEEPKNPDTCNVFGIFKLLASSAKTAEMRKNYEAGNYGYGHAKQELFELIIEKYAKERALFDGFMSNPDALETKLQQGEERAHELGSVVLNRVRKVLGFNRK
jgi:tryptophanyl-tRNA synthetase